MTESQAHAAWSALRNREQYMIVPVHGLWSSTPNWKVVAR